MGKRKFKMGKKKKAIRKKLRLKRTFGSFAKKVNAVIARESEKKFKLYEEIAEDTKLDGLNFVEPLIAVAEIA